MYCGQCGKKVLDTMLFCPFCGSPIVIPDQDAPEQAELPAREAPEASKPTAIAALEVPAEEAPEPASELAPEEGEARPEAMGEAAVPEASAQLADELPLESAPPRPAEPVEMLNFDEFESVASRSPQPAEPSSAETPAEEAPETARSRDASERLASLFEELDAAKEEPFTPLNLERMRRLEEDFPSLAKSVAAQRQARPPHSRPPKPGTRQTSPTFIPVKDVDPDDIFMDSSHPRRGEEADPYDEAEEDEASEEEFAFEEPEQGSFFQRHVRGMVGLILLATLVVVFLIWAAMPGGQRVLATSNLAWKAGVYDDLGHEAYEGGQYSRAAAYFERAFARDGDNYDYAHNAMVAYSKAGEQEDALAMLKKCIELRPDSVDPYRDLLNLYPDPAQRSWDVQQLLRQGYERTGDASLNDIGE